MQSAQIGESAAQQPSLVLVDTELPASAQQSGLLGSRRAQSPALTITSEFVEDEGWLFDFLRKRFVNGQPTSRLAILKGNKFTAEGREQRIRISLDALNTPQPITLTLEQWKEVVVEAAEEVDED